MKEKFIQPIRWYCGNLYLFEQVQQAYHDASCVTKCTYVTGVTNVTDERTDQLTGRHSYRNAIMYQVTFEKIHCYSSREII